MKVFSSNCTFDYSWNEVSTANWRKYCPWNDKSTHVVGVDTLSRSVDSGTGIVCFPAPPPPETTVSASEELFELISLLEYSCVQSDLSPVTSPYHNGFFLYLEGVPHLMSTKPPMSTPF